MAKFKNIVTGNVLETDNPLTIKLMENSDRYEAMDPPLRPQRPPRSPARQRPQRQPKRAPERRCKPWRMRIMSSTPPGILATS